MLFFCIITHLPKIKGRWVIIRFFRLLHAKVSSCNRGEKRQKMSLSLHFRILAAPSQAWPEPCRCQQEHCSSPCLHQGLIYTCMVHYTCSDCMNSILSQQKSTNNITNVADSVSHLSEPLFIQTAGKVWAGSGSFVIIMRYELQQLKCQFL